MRKNKLLLLLALLLTAATGAWAQTTYSVKMKDGTQDAKNWSIASGGESVKGDAADGLTGLSEGDQVTLQYTGRLKVKGVKATSDAAAASVPDGALSGVFSVSSTKKVYFSKGNLRYASGAWSFFDNQYDYYDSYSADAWDKFGWSTSATTYGMSTSTSISAYSGDFVDWGAKMGTGWFTLSSDEWTYLFNTRTVNGGTGDGKSYTLGQSVNSKLGVVIYPDNYTGAVYSGSDWASFESAGCVFLPIAGLRNGSSLNYTNSSGYYWSATPNGTNYAYRLNLGSNSMAGASNSPRYYGCSVRLVREVATSDAAQAYTLLSAATTSDCGKVVCAAGHLHDAKTAVPDGCTAVGILGKVTETGHGLILALKDATSQNWNTINGWTAVTTYAGTTLKVLPDDAARGTNLTSYTTLGATAVSNWAVAQKSDYEAIFTNLGSTKNNSGYTYDDNVNAYITTGVGGTAISGDRWSATGVDDTYAWRFHGNSWRNGTYKTSVYSFRPVLGF